MPTEIIERRFAAMGARVWSELLPSDVWVLPKSHWAYELQFGSHEWMPGLLREVGVRLDHLGQHLLELLQAGGGDDDGGVPGAVLFRDAQEPSARIVLQGDGKRLAFDVHQTGGEGVFLNHWFGLLIKRGGGAGLVAVSSRMIV